MTTLLTFLVNGVALGAVYGLLALGFVAVYKATEVLNFSHAGMVMVAGYLVWYLRTQQDLPFVVAVGMSLAAAAAVGAIIGRLTARAVAARSLVAASIITLGVEFMLQAEVNRRLAGRVLDLGDPWGSRVVHVGGISIAQSRLAAIVVALVLIAALFAALRFSSWGIAARAATEDREAAALMGIPLQRVAIAAWACAGLLAAVACLFLTTFPSPGLDTTTATIAFRALPAAIIGGLDSLEGAVLGGLVIGVGEILAQGYQSELGFLGDSFYTIVPYLIMMLVLLARPSGLFGTREVSRV